MSNDIFYTNISNLVTFYMGERPSADKFNAVNKYFSRGMRELATAIGDINDDGFPYIGLSGALGPSWNVSEAGEKKRLLDIVSLARIIGPASNLNSRMHLNYLQENENIQETISANSRKYELLHPVDETLPITVQGYEKIDSKAPFTGVAQFKLLNQREILFANLTTAELTVSYFTSPNEYYGGVDYENAGFNVIPDPNQTLGVQVRFLEDRKYEITFPTITAQQSGLSELKSSNISSDNEFNNAKSYELPKWLIESILDTDGNIIDENRVIPGNFLYLKNRRTQEVYKDAVYEYENKKTLIVSNIDLCEEEDGSYSNTDYCVILTGTNITNLLDDLRLKWFKHTHDGTFGESPIEFKSLVGKFMDISPSGIYGPSSNEWNQMPMYLHRDGYVQDDNLNNGNNAMRGNLALGLENFNPLGNSSSIMEDEGTSHKIFFGGLPTFMYRAVDTLMIINDAGSLHALSSEQMLLKSKYNLEVISEGLGNQSLNITNERSNILIESPKNIKVRDLNSKEYIDVNTVEKNVTLNEGFIIREYDPNDLILEAESKRVPKEEWANKKVILKEGTNVKNISHSTITFNLLGSSSDFTVNQNGYIMTNIYNNKFKNEAAGGTTVYSALDLTDTNLSADAIDWVWDDGNEISSVLSQLSTITDVRRQVYSGIPAEWSSVLTLNNPTTMNCSYNVNLYTEKTVEHVEADDPFPGILTDLNDDGSVKDTAIIIPHGSYAKIRYNNTNTNNPPDINYHVVEINRSLNLARMEVDPNESIQNVFYFKINLPRGHDVPLHDDAWGTSDYNKSQFGRFLIRFDYGGYSKTIQEDGVEKQVYVSSNPAYSNPSADKIFLNIIDGISIVTLNGKALDDTEGIQAGMHTHIAGPNDPYPMEQPLERAIVRRSREGFVNGILARTGTMEQLGGTTPIDGWIDYILDGLEEIIEVGVGEYYSAENIINEYKATTFTSNQFRANRWYKVEEEIFNKKVFLKITG